MTGAMYAAIAGLKTHMSKMNVIGNNIANVNTVGYKSQRTIFKDAMYTMYKSGSDGTTTTGGHNPAQIGYGSQISTIDLNMSSGSYAPGNAMDCMIDGDGFFLVGDKTVAEVIDGQNPTSFKTLSLTRVGDFSFDAGGYLVDGNGNCVYGFMSVGVSKDPLTAGQPIVSDQLVPIRLPQVATEYYTRDADGNEEILGPDDETDGALTRTIVRYPVVAEVDEDADADEDPLLAEDLEQFDMMNYEDYANLNAQDEADRISLAFAQMQSISIDETTGRVSGIVKGGEWITIGFIAIGNVTNPNGVTHTGGFYYQASDGAGDLQVAMMGDVADELIAVGGGKLQYVNGSLAEGEDPEFSSRAMIGNAGKTGLLTGGLEGSNVDLATEISEMITTQRGYQANTRIITVTDAMLEELVNMKR